MSSKFPQENFGQNSIHSMPHYTVNCPSWWNLHEQHFPRSLSKDLSLKVEPPPQLCQEAKNLGLQRQEQDSSSTQSGQSQKEVTTAMGGTNSQDQCILSESVQDEGSGNRVDCQMKPLLFMGNPNFAINPSHVDVSQSMTSVPYAYADPYFSGLFAAYGPQGIPQMVGMAPARIPLPLDLTEDGPIYVNAKQYHGILRRRQTRAKLEAQNKVVKNRRAYLHESRHLHALNRVRGSGGRFLSTKKPQQPDGLDPSLSTSSNCGSDLVRSFEKRVRSEFEVRPSETVKFEASIASCTGITRVNNGGAIFQQPDRMFTNTSPHMGVAMQGSGRLVCNGTQHCAPVVR